jgi:hypothetical protein
MAYMQLNLNVQYLIKICLQLLIIRYIVNLLISNFLKRMNLMIGLMIGKACIPVYQYGIMHFVIIRKIREMIGQKE